MLDQAQLEQLGIDGCGVLFGLLATVQLTGPQVSVNNGALDVT